MQVFVLGSGSSGNSILLEAEGERILLDAGIGPTRSAERMRTLGAELITSRPPLGLFVTHEHGDHAAQAIPMARALRTPIFAHDRASLDRARRRLDVRAYVPGRPTVLGPFLVEALPVPHDAPQVALRISAGRCRVALATDLGHVTRELKAFLSTSDMVFLESNYCPELLDSGPYPPRLKARVAGPIGHLANTQAADVAAALECTRVGTLVLVHLSQSNNTPERALDVVSSRARRLDVMALPHGKPHRFSVVGGSAEQLAFAF